MAQRLLSTPACTTAARRMRPTSPRRAMKRRQQDSNSRLDSMPTATLELPGISGAHAPASATLLLARAPPGSGCCCAASCCCALRANATPPTLPLPSQPPAAVAPCGGVCRRNLWTGAVAGPVAGYRGRQGLADAGSCPPEGLTVAAAWSAALSKLLSSSRRSGCCLAWPCAAAGPQPAQAGTPGGRARPASRATVWTWTEARP